MFNIIGFEVFGCFLSGQAIRCYSSPVPGHDPGPDSGVSAGGRCHAILNTPFKHRSLQVKIEVIRNFNHYNDHEMVL